jgi:PmbA protein
MSTVTLAGRMPRSPLGGALGSPEAGVELAERIVVSEARPGDHGVELFLHDAYEANVNLIPGLPGVATTAGGGLGVAVRVWRNGRCGFAARAASREAEIARLVAEARADAMSGGGDAPMPVDLPAAAGLQRRAEMSEGMARQRAEELRAGLAEAGLAVQVVLLRQYQWWTAVVSTAGVRTTEWHDQVTGLARCETAHGTLVDGVECDDIAERWDAGPALRHALEAQAVIAAARRHEPDRRLPLLLRPVIASHLVASLGWMLRGTTAASTAGLPGAVGRRLFPACLTLVDDPVHPGVTLPRLVDDEGRRAVSVELVREGVLRGFLHSTASAAALGAEPNGRAIRLGVSAPPMPVAQGLHVRPHGDRPPGDHIEVTTRFETLSTMPRPGIITLVVAGWEVRDGRRVRAVGPFDLDLPLLATWRTLRGVGDDLEFVPVADRCGTPSILLAPAAWPS